MPDPPTVRDQLFMLAHDEDHNFRPQMHLPALGLGLVGATIIDLMMWHRVQIQDGRACLVDLYDRRPAGDPISDHVLQLVRNLHPAPPLTGLLREIAPDMYDRTLGGLLAAGVVTRIGRRLRPRYAPAEQAVMIRIRAKVRYRVNGDQRDDVITDALCALTSALDLQHCLLFNLSRREVDERLQEITNRIPTLVGRNSPLAAIPATAEAVRRAVGDHATAVYR